MSVQIVVDDSSAGARCGGLPPAVRALHRAASELPGCRVVVDQTSTLPLRYPEQTAQARLDASPLKPNFPLLALAGDGFAGEGELQFLAARGAPALGVAEGRVVAAYLPEAGELAFMTASEAARAALAADGERVALPWTSSRTKVEARAAEDALCARLAKETDGYLARFDRRLSIALTRRLLPYPVTPDALTSASLALALLGCWWLASGERAWQTAGVLLLWVCAILDGCDGELARLKLLRSDWGARYDLWVDHITHLAAFCAIVAASGLELLRPGLVLLSGAALSAWTVARAKALPLWAERLASRDYVYLLAPLAALGRLDWFVWAASAGSHAFWLALLLTPRPSSAASPLPLPES